MNLPNKPLKGVRKQALLTLAKMPQAQRAKFLKLEALRRGIDLPKKG